MSGLVIWSWDWVPPPPRGFVRDLRLRWACEEAGLDYEVRTVPFEGRGPEHFRHQAFGQIPWLSDGDVELFESGAGLLHLADKSDVLMPADATGRAETLQWVIAALNSIEMASVPWWFIGLNTPPADNPLTGWLTQRLDHMEAVLAEREWLVADRFTVADLLMADVLRVPAVRAFGDRPATEAYVARVTARPAFLKARADQMALFEAGDAARGIKP